MNFEREFLDSLLARGLRARSRLRVGPHALAKGMLEGLPYVAILLLLLLLLLEPGPGFGVGRGFAIWDPFPVQAPDKAPETCTWSTRSEGGRQLAEPQPRRKPDRLEVPKMRWTCESPVS